MAVTVDVVVVVVVVLVIVVVVVVVVIISCQFWLLSWQPFLKKHASVASFI